MENLPSHPAADIFPVMSDEDLAELANDIREHGLNDAVVIYGGRVLDGRNRLRACEIAGVEPRFTTWDGRGGEPFEYVVSCNLHRRHLTVSQRAAIALELLPMLREEAKERQLDGQVRGARTPTGESSPPNEGEDSHDGEATAQAAQLLGVGRSTVERAARVAKRNPKLIDQVKKGEKTLEQAQREVGLATTRTPIHEGVKPVYYGKGDKWHKSTQPLLRYLAGWETRGYEFRHVNLRNARKRVKVIDEIMRHLEAARVDLEKRTHEGWRSGR